MTLLDVMSYLEIPAAELRVTVHNSHVSKDARCCTVTLDTPQCYARKNFNTGTPSAGLRQFLDSEAADMDIFAIGKHVKSIKQEDYDKLKKQWLENLKKREGGN